MKKLFLIHSEQEKFHGRVNRWKDYELHFSPFGYEDFIAHTGRTDDEMKVYWSVVHEVAERADGYDAVWGESPETLLIQLYRYQKGMKRLPFIVTEQDMMQRLKILGKLIESEFGGNPVHDFLRREENFWIHMTRSQRDTLIAEGIPGDKLYYYACSSYTVIFVAPEQHKIFSEVGGDAGPAGGEFSNSILVPGSNHRDHETLLRAVEGLSEPVNIVCSFNRYDKLKSPNVKWHDFMPIRDYLRAIKSARIVIVPMVKTGISGGEVTTTFAMAFGKPVIATRDAATEDFMTDSVDGLLVEPGDAAGLRSAIDRLLGDPEFAARLGENARLTEKRLAETCERNMTELFSRATEWKPAL